MRPTRLVVGLALVACSKVPTPGPSLAPEASSSPFVCGDGRAMTVRFYDVGQGLAVLVDLPDGRHVLVDTGDEPHRSGCGEACEAANARLLASLRADLHGAPIDLLWLTHPHSDHIGGAPSVLEAFSVRRYVDDGRSPEKGEVRRARRAAEEHGVPVQVVQPGETAVPLASSGDLRITAVVPPAWPPSCARDPNECSIGLRIDDCASSVLLLGDAEHEEEALLDPGGPVTLLQVAHHGSETSTSPAFLSKAKPKYAVVSAGKPGEGMNRDYCHPRALVVKRLSRVLGGEATRTLVSFDGERCDRATAADWVAVPSSGRLWATERDGTVVLTTTGDGVFRRVGGE
ncbi:MAG TPA: MBL fold metallo-hydrolase [Polyangiaceae bacterium]